ncbi:MAG: sulfatase-like hydrolase/transferase [Spirochaetaceae bacterium]
MKKPNILFLLTDDQRFDTIAALGNKEVSTPNMDELVRHGVSFTNAHIPGGTCGAVCMPSRAMIHTGKTLFNLADNGSYIPEEHNLLGEELQKIGYETCGIGKWHNSPRSYARSFTSGGEIFFGGMWDHWNIPACNFDPTGNYDYSVPYISDAFHSRVVDNMVSDHITPGKHSSTLFADFAIDWLKDYKDEKPFFLYTAFMAPHDPRTMPKEYQEMYKPEDISLPENYKPEHNFEYGVRQIRDEVLAPYPRTKIEIKTHLAEYYGMISHLDFEIGNIIQTLKDKGVYENTIIILAGDNGLALGQHGLMGKQSAYEHSIRVPLIFTGPGIPKDKISNNPCYLLDIYPTIFDLLNIEVPEGNQGISLFDDLNIGSSSNSRDSLYFAYADLLRSVKKDGFKLIEYAGEYGKKTQLFNLEKDPWENNNLSKSTEYCEILKKLKLELQKQRKQWNDIDSDVSKKFWAAYF